MASVYWFGNGGNWSDQANHWSNNSGNSPASLHGAAPGTNDDAIFDVNSITGGGQVIIVDAAATCLSINFTGVANTPDFRIADGITLSCYGSATFVSGMTCTYTAAAARFRMLATGTLTTGGLVLAFGQFVIAGAAGITVQLGFVNYCQCLAN